MKALTIQDKSLIEAIQIEIRNTKEARYDHRLHTVLTVAQGLTCPQAARLMGDGVKTVETWVKAFNDEGFGGLWDEDRTGRPRRLKEEQMKELKEVLNEKTPEAVGLTGNLWDGKTLSIYIQKRYKTTLGVRQCQRMFQDLGFRFRKPRPVSAEGDKNAQGAFKKS
jgi:transposase